MRAGKLRHRVTLEYATVSANTYGEPEKTWHALGERWARVSPVTGKERWTGDQVDAVVSHEVEIRYMPDVRSDLRVWHRDRLLHVEAVLNPDERNETLLLLCREIADSEAD